MSKDQPRKPAWQLLPELSAEEFAALKADIAAFGLRVPIVVDAATGEVVDGHHRQRALDELRAEGVKVADYRDVRAFASDEERLAPEVRPAHNAR